MSKPVIKFTIDGRPCAAKPGQTIYEAARDNGIYIPTLCHDPRLTPTARCGLCLVDVTGLGRVQAAM